MPASRSLLLAVPDPDRRVAISTRNCPRVQSRRMQRVQSSAGIPSASFSTVMDAVAACCFFDGRPRPGLEAGTWSPGSSVQMRWVRCTSATKISFSSSNRLQKGRLLAITAVDAHPRKPNSPGARPAHDVQREFALRRLLARGLGNPRPLAARRVLDPALSANRAAHRSACGARHRSAPRTPRPDNCRSCPAAPSIAGPRRPNDRPAWESCSRR